jgi:hypothetical protein
MCLKDDSLDLTRRQTEETNKNLSSAPPVDNLHHGQEEVPAHPTAGTRPERCLSCHSYEALFERAQAILLVAHGSEDGGLPFTYRLRFKWSPESPEFKWSPYRL